jgi:hypothetical protein
MSASTFETQTLDAADGLHAVGASPFTFGAIHVEI